MVKAYFSTEGIKKFSEEIKNIENQIIKLQSKMNEYAETGGNLWHDNFAYENARRDITMLNERLAGFYDIRNNLEVIDYSIKGDHIQMGCRVTFKFNDDTKTFNIVGFGESDPKNEKIAYNTPLAKALIFKKKRDKFKQKIGKLEKRIEIISIEPINKI